MNPKETADTLRRIATAIDNSKNPSISLVRRDIASVISKIAEEQQEEQQEKVSQQEQQALPVSKGGKQMINDYLEKLNKAYEDGDHRAFKEMLKKLDKAAVD